MKKYTNNCIFGLERGAPIGKHPSMTDMDKRECYRQVREKAQAVLHGETDAIAAMATVACLLAHAFPRFYWTGFYRLLDGELVIGPYQGTLGCLRIALDRGVCGAAASAGETIMVQNVHEFPGHIACDPLSNSEIVVPVKNAAGDVVAVLDLDSKELAAFDQSDQECLEDIVGLLTDVCSS